MEKYSLSQRRRERNTSVSRITIHCHSKFNNERMIKIMTEVNPYISFNYLIDIDGNTSEVIPEKYGSWSTGSPENDNAAINILCSLSDPVYLTEIVFNSMVNLCAETVKKYGYKKLLWNPNGDYKNVPNDAMVITMHKLVNPYGRGKGCVPELVENQFGELALRVTEEVKR